jgi:hypothetical protein
MAGTRYSTPLGADSSSAVIDAGTLARTAPPLAGPIGLSGDAVRADAGSSVPLGTQVVQFAQARRRRRVGDGECFTLADQALRTAGAKSASDFGTITADADYIWGTSVAVSSVQPGDIVQFRDYKYTRRNDKDDGSWQENSQERPHHTAIVVSNDGNGLLTVIEQNAPPGSAVREIQLGFTSTKFESGGTKVQITVSGQVSFYRPQAR